MKVIARILSLATVLLAACDGARPETVVCAGDCVCQSTGDCAPGLGCEHGFCVRLDCERGSQGCACYGDGGCDLAEGEPLSCIANSCRSAAKPAGALGGACDEATACAAGLECLQGMCEEPGCPAGTLGCGCGPYGACSDYEGRPARCGVDERCALAGCVPGASGCPCAGPGCEAGLTCERALCRSANRLLAVRAEPGEARACDALLVSRGGKAQVTFDAAVKGVAMARAPRVALSFVSRADQGLSGTVATLVLDEPAAMPTTTYQLSQATCYDRTGRPLAAAGLSLAQY